jgi:hypothetical protein
MDAHKGKMVTLKIFLMAAICLTAAGCKTIGRMIGASAAVVKVRVTTDASDKNAATEKAANIIRRKADALDLDIDVARVPNESDVLVITFFDHKPSDAIKDMLFKVHRLELKKAIENGHPPIMFQSEDAAKETLKSGEEVLPIKEVRDNSSPTFLAVESKPVITGDDIRNAHIFKVPDMDRP